MGSYRYIKWSAAVAGVAIPIVAVFFLLMQSGDIEVHSITQSEHCAGTDSDICWLEMEFTPNKDIFLGADERWLDTNPPVKGIKLYRNWGIGWREIPLEKGCTGSWCGCYWCSGGNTAKYAIVFRNQSRYTIRFEAEKYDPRDVIDWSINPVGIWDVALAKQRCDLETLYWEEGINHYLTEEVCQKTVCEPLNKSCVVTEKCYDTTVLDYTETINHSKEVCIEGTERIEYAESVLETSKENIKCTINSDNLVCDDGRGADGDGSGTCESGETCHYYDLTDKIELESIMNGVVRIK